MPTKLLIANRGEIARRINRTARRLDIETVAVFSDADADAPFVKEASSALRIGPPPPKESYANVDAIVAALKASGATALHPGYGFLSENERLVAACESLGVAFVGPTVAAMKAMAGKIESKITMVAAGVPVVPGPIQALETEDDAVAAAEAAGWPVMLKASAGGGGIGMAKCRNEKQLRSAFDDARKKGELFFGSSRVFVEKCIEKPHHIEVQILADQFGNVHHLYERECSVQRRNQKVLEETPSPLVDRFPGMRERLCSAAVSAARAVGYTNAGTVEFVGAEDGSFFFLEMNTRLQVEHPITEMTTGVDLVELQLRVAAGERFDSLPLKRHGHAIELRVCAEDPEKRFFPSPGTISEAVWPVGDGIRVDAGVESGSVVPPFYDSLLAKMIGHGSSRSEAIARLLAALETTRVVGVKTNLEMHKKILANETFVRGETDTGFLEAALGLKS
ncbi:MAG: biotin carboxylase N-terminal domain-containing protein [Deltaproteobacteria bacterium]|nr:biotin carboxylase N-terminal domain-containing protein [Deltaproteobacteria bacterium]